MLEVGDKVIYHNKATEGKDGTMSRVARYNVIECMHPPKLEKKKIQASYD